jgi:hypothetical protein
MSEEYGSRSSLVPVIFGNREGHDFSHADSGFDVDFSERAEGREDAFA